MGHIMDTSDPLSLMSSREGYLHIYYILPPKIPSSPNTPFPPNILHTTNIKS